MTPDDHRRALAHLASARHRLATTAALAGALAMAALACLVTAAELDRPLAGWLAAACAAAAVALARDVDAALARDRAADAAALDQRPPRP